MKTSVAHLVRFLQARIDGTMCVPDDISHELTLAACRAYDRGVKLNCDTVYVASAYGLPRTVRLPEGSILLVAGSVPTNVRIDGWHMTVEGANNTQLLNDVLELFQGFADFESGLHAAVESGALAQDLVDLATPLFGNEILLMDSRLRMVAHSYDRIALYDVSGIDQLDDFGFAPAEVSDFFHNDAIFQGVENMREPFYYDTSVFAVRVYCINIFVQGEYASRLVLSETAHEIERCDENLFKYFGAFVQRLYDQVSVESDSRDDALATVVEDLLDNVSVMPARIDAAYERRGWSRDDMLVCACLMPAGYGAHERTIPLLCRRISRDYPETCAVERDGYVAMLVNLSTHEDNPDSFFAHMSIMQRESNLRIGQSPVFKDVEEVSGRFAQAKAALEIARDQGLQQWRNSFSSLRLEFLERVLGESMESRMLVAEEIDKLARYDEDNGTNYVETLRAYLDAQMNAQSAAINLFIHRATMVYRLRRIREIGGIDFDDADQLFYLYLSLRVLT